MHPSVVVAAHRTHAVKHEGGIGRLFDVLRYKVISLSSPFYCLIEKLVLCNPTRPGPANLDDQIDNLPPRGPDKEYRHRSPGQQWLV